MLYYSIKTFFKNLELYIYIYIYIKNNIYFLKSLYCEHCLVKNLGIGNWRLGIGDWGLGPIPNPQSPIPNPQSPIWTYKHEFEIFLENMEELINLKIKI